MFTLLFVGLPLGVSAPRNARIDVHLLLIALTMPTHCISAVRIGSRARIGHKYT